MTMHVVSIDMSFLDAAAELAGNMKHPVITAAHLLASELTDEKNHLESGRSVVSDLPIHSLIMDNGGDVDQVMAGVSTYLGNIPTDDDAEDGGVDEILSDAGMFILHHLSTTMQDPEEVAKAVNAMLVLQVCAAIEVRDQVAGITKILSDAGVDVNGFIGDGSSYMDGEPTHPNVTNSSGPKKAAGKQQHNGGAIETYCTPIANLTKDIIVPYGTVRDDVYRVLVQQDQIGAFVTGKPGCGKSSHLHGIMQAFANNEVPVHLRGTMVLNLNAERLVTNVRVPGTVTNRLIDIVHEASYRSNRVLIVIDNVHLLDTKYGGDGVATLLRIGKAAPHCRFLGATSQELYAKTCTSGDVSRYFTQVQVEKPENDIARNIVRLAAGSKSEHHKCIFSLDAIDHAIDMADRFIKKLAIPASAIQVMDYAAAHHSGANGANHFVTISDIAQAVAKLSGAPAASVSKTDLERLQSLHADLSSRVFGQEQAVDALEQAIVLAKAGLTDENKPLGVFLFSGPTGVGKTEMAKTLADSMGMPLFRVDMAEYTEKHTISKLVGSPPGYIGYDDTRGGILSEIADHPGCVLLLDEVEKAHPEVYNLFLGGFDNGHIRMSSGNIIDLTNTIVIMTTNAGAAANEKNSIGFNRDKRSGEDDIAINQFFSPEFRNRLNAIIKFNRLGPDNLRMLVAKIITDMNAKIAKKKFKVMLDDSAIEWVINQGTSPNGREIGRLIDREVKGNLAKTLLSNPVGGNLTYTVNTDNSGLCLKQ